MEPLIVLFDENNYNSTIKMQNQNTNKNNVYSTKINNYNSNCVVILPKVLKELSSAEAEIQALQAKGETASIGFEYEKTEDTSYSRNIVNDHCLSLCTEYADDILHHLFIIEIKRKAIYYKSPQLFYRSSLVDLIKKCGEILKLNITTVHFAVYLLDVFMDSFKIATHKLHLIALVCVLLASKMEENIQDIPQIDNLNDIVDNVYNRKDFKLVEQKIIKLFDFNLSYPTIANFIEMYSDKFYTLEDHQTTNTTTTTTTNSEVIHIFYGITLSKLQNLLHEFADIVLQDHSLFNIRPSFMAAACICATRKTMNIKPIWTNRLEKLTTYEFKQIDLYVDLLIYQRQLILDSKNIDKNSSPDSGYLSDSLNFLNDTELSETENLGPPPTKKCRKS